jgi:flagellar basal-body rod modification protein FlgD
MKSMAQQFTSLQVLQGASMVGRDVLSAGNTLTPNAAGLARGAIDLDGTVDNVKVDIFSPSGQAIGTINGGSQQAGRYYFSWDTSQYPGMGNPTFKVTATSGGKTIGTTSMVQNTVTSVGSENGTLSVQLQGRNAIAYSDIKAIL